MKTIIITGGTGLVGWRLTEMLAASGNKVIIFTRSKEYSSTDPRITYSTWQPGKLLCDKEAIRGANAIINLAGAGIADKRWTPVRKKEIYDSRINSSKTIAKVLGETTNEVSVVVNASAIGFYGGGDGKTEMKEDVPSGKGFLADVCNDWETEIKKVGEFKKRWVILRTGMVLARNGGAWPKITKPLKFGIAPLIGSGREAMLWIHIDDLCRMYMEAVENENLSGVYNACAPQVISGKEFMIAAAKGFGKKAPLMIHTPLFLLRTILGEVVDEALIQNVRINSDKILCTGFHFRFPTIEEAVKNLR